MNNFMRRMIGFFLIILFIVFFLNLFLGSIPIPFSVIKNILLGKKVYFTAWENIVLQSRFPRAVTALFSGSALAISGLMLQTLFKNPLSGPDILGISGGANLGVAILLLYFRGIFGIESGFHTLMRLSTVAVAFIGAVVVLSGILFFSTQIKSHAMVLILGIMIGCLVSSGISILYSFASLESLRSYVLWGLGSFTTVSTNDLPFFCGCIIIGLITSTFLIKPLNILSLGENYSINLGINIKWVRIAILSITGFLTAVVTAFCGPISFIGMIIPHIARIVVKTSNQTFLFFVTLFLGSIIALFCNLATVVSFGDNHLLPLNAVTPLIGAPIIIYLIMSGRRVNDK